ncbi:hypothetical protein BOX15_Mlig005900g1 [Macrostomum lignano]|uniref:Galectin domain-containing protein n=1 Tax=Macrostomum lignano TaxID=282301 RepID=A0A267GX50_9PLAT|nr:hypothetical protein BOX15_Mlig005900g1 [Macrostomum lignano]
MMKFREPDRASELNTEHRVTPESQWSDSSHIEHKMSSELFVGEGVVAKGILHGQYLNVTLSAENWQLESINISLSSNGQFEISYRSKGKQTDRRGRLSEVIVTPYSFVIKVAVQPLGYDISLQEKHLAELSHNGNYSAICTVILGGEADFTELEICDSEEPKVATEPENPYLNVQLVHSARQLGTPSHVKRLRLSLPRVENSIWKPIPIFSEESECELKNDDRLNHEISHGSVQTMPKSDLDAENARLRRCQRRNADTAYIKPSSNFSSVVEFEPVDSKTSIEPKFSTALYKRDTHQTVNVNEANAKAQENVRKTSANNVGKDVIESAWLELDDPAKEGIETVMLRTGREIVSKAYDDDNKIETGVETSLIKNFQRKNETMSIQIGTYECLAVTVDERPSKEEIRLFKYEQQRSKSPKLRRKHKSHLSHSRTLSSIKSMMKFSKLHQLQQKRPQNKDDKSSGLPSTTLLNHTEDTTSIRKQQQGTDAEQRDESIGAEVDDIKSLVMHLDQDVDEVRIEYEDQQVSMELPEPPIRELRHESQSADLAEETEESVLARKLQQGTDAEQRDESIGAEVDDKNSLVMHLDQDVDEVRIEYEDQQISMELPEPPIRELRHESQSADLAEETEESVLARKLQQGTDAEQRDESIGAEVDDIKNLVKHLDQDVDEVRIEYEDQQISMELPEPIIHEPRRYGHSFDRDSQISKESDRSWQSDDLLHHIRDAPVDERNESRSIDLAEPKSSKIVKRLSLGSAEFPPIESKVRLRHTSGESSAKREKPQTRPHSVSVTGTHDDKSQSSGSQSSMPLESSYPPKHKKNVFGKFLGVFKRHRGSYNVSDLDTAGNAENEASFRRKQSSQLAQRNDSETNETQVPSMSRDPDTVSQTKSSEQDNQEQVGSSSAATKEALTQDQQLSIEISEPSIRELRHESQSADLAEETEESVLARKLQQGTDAEQRDESIGAEVDDIKSLVMHLDQDVDEVRIEYEDQQVSMELPEPIIHEPRRYGHSFDRDSQISKESDRSWQSDDLLHHIRDAPVDERNESRSIDLAEPKSSKIVKRLSLGSAEFPPIESKVRLRHTSGESSAKREKPQTRPHSVSVTGTHDDKSQSSGSQSSMPLESSYPPKHKKNVFGKFLGVFKRHRGSYNVSDLDTAGNAENEASFRRKQSSQLAQRNDSETNETQVPSMSRDPDTVSQTKSSEQDNQEQVGSSSAATKEASTQDQQLSIEISEPSIRELRHESQSADLAEETEESVLARKLQQGTDAEQRDESIGAEVDDIKSLVMHLDQDVDEVRIEYEDQQVSMELPEPIIHEPRRYGHSFDRDSQISKESDRSWQSDDLLHHIRDAPVDERNESRSIDLAEPKSSKIVKRLSLGSAEFPPIESKVRLRHTSGESSAKREKPQTRPHSVSVTGTHDDKSQSSGSQSSMPLESSYPPKHKKNVFGKFLGVFKRHRGSYNVSDLDTAGNAENEASFRRKQSSQLAQRNDSETNETQVPSMSRDPDTVSQTKSSEQDNQEQVGSSSAATKEASTQDQQLSIEISEPSIRELRHESQSADLAEETEESVLARKLQQGTDAEQRDESIGAEVDDIKSLVMHLDQDVDEVRIEYEDQQVSMELPEPIIHEPRRYGHSFDRDSQISKESDRSWQSDDLLHHIRDAPVDERNESRSIDLAEPKSSKIVKRLSLGSAEFPPIESKVRLRHTSGESSAKREKPQTRPHSVSVTGTHDDKSQSSGSQSSMPLESSYPPKHKKNVFGKFLGVFKRHRGSYNVSDLDTAGNAENEASFRRKQSSQLAQRNDSETNETQVPSMSRDPDTVSQTKSSEQDNQEQVGSSSAATKEASTQDQQLSIEISEPSIRELRHESQSADLAEETEESVLARKLQQGTDAEQRDESIGAEVDDIKSLVKHLDQDVDEVRIEYEDQQISMELPEPIIHEPRRYGHSFDRDSQISKESDRSWQSDDLLHHIRDAPVDERNESRSIDLAEPKSSKIVKRLSLGSAEFPPIESKVRLRHTSGESSAKREKPQTRPHSVSVTGTHDDKSQSSGSQSSMPLESSYPPKHKKNVFGKFLGVFKRHRGSYNVSDLDTAGNAENEASFRRKQSSQLAQRNDSETNETQVPSMSRDPDTVSQTKSSEQDNQEQVGSSSAATKEASTQDQQLSIEISEPSIRELRHESQSADLAEETEESVLARKLQQGTDAEQRDESIGAEVDDIKSLVMHLDQDVDEVRIEYEDQQVSMELPEPIIHEPRRYGHSFDRDSQISKESDRSWQSDDLLHHIRDAPVDERNESRSIDLAEPKSSKIVKRLSLGSAEFPPIESKVRLRHTSGESSAKREKPQTRPHSVSVTGTHDDKSQSSGSQSSMPLESSYPPKHKKNVFGKFLGVFKRHRGSYNVSDLDTAGNAENEASFRRKQSSQLAQRNDSETNETQVPSMSRDPDTVSQTKSSEQDNQEQVGSSSAATKEASTQDQQLSIEISEPSIRELRHESQSADLAEETEESVLARKLQQGTDAEQRDESIGAEVDDIKSLVKHLDQDVDEVRIEYEDQQISMELPEPIIHEPRRYGHSFDRDSQISKESDRSLQSDDLLHHIRDAPVDERNESRSIDLAEPKSSKIVKRLSLGSAEFPPIESKERLRHTSGESSTKREKPQTRPHSVSVTGTHDDKSQSSGSQSSMPLESSYPPKHKKNVFGKFLGVFKRHRGSYNVSDLDTAGNAENEASFRRKQSSQLAQRNDSETNETQVPSMSRDPAVSQTKSSEQDNQEQVGSSSAATKEASTQDQQLSIEISESSIRELRHESQSADLAEETEESVLARKLQQGTDAEQRDESLGAEVDDIKNLVKHLDQDVDEVRIEYEDQQISMELPEPIIHEPRRYGHSFDRDSQISKESDRSWQSDDLLHHIRDAPVDERNESRSIDLAEPKSSKIVKRLSLGSAEFPPIESKVRLRHTSGESSAKREKPQTRPHSVSVTGTHDDKSQSSGSQSSMPLESSYPPKHKKNVFGKFLGVFKRHRGSYNVSDLDTAGNAENEASFRRKQSSQLAQRNDSETNETQVPSMSRDPDTVSQTKSSEQDNQEQVGSSSAATKEALTQDQQLSIEISESSIQELRHESQSADLAEETEESVLARKLQQGTDAEQRDESIGAEVDDIKSLVMHLDQDVDEVRIEYEDQQVSMELPEPPIRELRHESQSADLAEETEESVLARKLQQGTDAEQRDESIGAEVDDIKSLVMHLDQDVDEVRIEYEDQQVSMELPEPPIRKLRHESQSADLAEETEESVLARKLQQGTDAEQRDESIGAEVDDIKNLVKHLDQDVDEVRIEYEDQQISMELPEPIIHEPRRYGHSFDRDSQISKESDRSLQSDDLLHHIRDAPVDERNESRSIDLAEPKSSKIVKRLSLGSAEFPPIESKERLRHTSGESSTKREKPQTRPHSVSVTGTHDDKSQSSGSQSSMPLESSYPPKHKKNVFGKFLGVFKRHRGSYNVSDLDTAGNAENEASFRRKQSSQLAQRNDSETNETQVPSMSRDPVSQTKSSEQDNQEQVGSSSAATKEASTQDQQLSIEISESSIRELRHESQSADLAEETEESVLARKLQQGTDAEQRDESIGAEVDDIKSLVMHLDQDVDEVRIEYEDQQVSMELPEPPIRELRHESQSADLAEETEESVLARKLQQGTDAEQRDESLGAEVDDINSLVMHLDQDVDEVRIEYEDQQVSMELPEPPIRELRHESQSADLAEETEESVLARKLQQGTDAEQRDESIGAEVDDIKSLVMHLDQDVDEVRIEYEDQQVSMELPEPPIRELRHESQSADLAEETEESVLARKLQQGTDAEQRDESIGAEVDDIKNLVKHLDQDVDEVRIEYEDQQISMELPEPIIHEPRRYGHSFDRDSQISKESDRSWQSDDLLHHIRDAPVDERNESRSIDLAEPKSSKIVKRLSLGSAEFPPIESKERLRHTSGESSTKREKPQTRPHSVSVTGTHDDKSQSSGSQSSMPLESSYPPKHKKNVFGKFLGVFKRHRGSYNVSDLDTAGNAENEASFRRKQSSQLAQRNDSETNETQVPSMSRDPDIVSQTKSSEQDNQEQVGSSSAATKEASTQDQQLSIEISEPPIRELRDESQSADLAEETEESVLARKLQQGTDAEQRDESIGAEVDDIKSLVMHLDQDVDEVGIEYEDQQVSMELPEPPIRELRHESQSADLAEETEESVLARKLQQGTDAEQRDESLGAEVDDIKSLVMHLDQDVDEVRIEYEDQQVSMELPEPPIRELRHESQSADLAEETEESVLARKLQQGTDAEQRDESIGAEVDDKKSLVMHLDQDVDEDRIECEDQQISMELLEPPIRELRDESQSADLAEETEESVLARKLQQGTDAEQRDESIGAEVDDIKNLVKHLDQDVDEVRIEYEDQQVSMELPEPPIRELRHESQSADLAEETEESVLARKLQQGTDAEQRDESLGAEVDDIKSLVMHLDQDVDEVRIEYEDQQVSMELLEPPIRELRHESQSADLAEETEESVLARKLQQGTDAEQRDESIGAEVDDIKNLVKHLDQDVDEVRIEYEDQQISMELQEASSGQEKASSDLEKGTNEISFPSEAIDIVRCLEFNDNPNTSVPSYIYAKPTIKEGMDPMSKLDFTCLDDTSTDISNRTPAAAGVENVTFQTERSVKGLLDRNLAEESDKSTASHASQNSPEFEGASPLSETASLDQNHSLSVHTVTQGGFQPEHIESEEEKTCFKDAHSEDKPFDSNTNSSVVDTVSPSSTVSHYYDNQPSRKSYSLEESNSPRSNNENLRDSSPLSNDSKLSNDKALVQTEVQQAELKQEQAENSSDPELNAIEISAATTAHEISLPKVLDGTPTLVRQECESRESLQSVIESASSAAEGADTGTRGQLDDVVQQPGRLSASEDEDSEADNDEPPYFFDGGSIAANQTNATLNSKWTEQSKLRDGRSPEPIGPNTHVEEADHHAIMSNGTDVMISTLAKMPGANQKPSRAQDAAKFGVFRYSSYNLQGASGFVKGDRLASGCSSETDGSSSDDSSSCSEDSFKQRLAKKFSAEPASLRLSRRQVNWKKPSGDHWQSEAFNSPSGDGPRAGSDRELSNSLQFGDGSHGDTLEFQLTNESAIEDLERRKNAKGFSTLKPIIPFRARLPVQIRYGHSIVIYGRMTNYSSAGLKLSLENLDYSPGAQAFELLISFPGGADQPSLMHTCQLIGGQPVCEAKALLSPKQNDEFRLVICFKRLGLSTALADTECVLPHHIPVSDFTHLVLHPDCEYTSVEFHERLELPLREHLACPLSLVESVRLGLRPDSSSTGLLFGLADGAAMTCSLSIASLTATVGRADPDDTCSSNGGDDGGGFVKEMEKRGLNQLAKLRSVLLTIHGQVVRIHINGEYIMTYLMKLDARRVKSLYIEGDLMLEDFKIKEMRANPLTALPKQLPVGGQIRIWARLLPSAASMPAGNNCRISLRTGADPSSADFALLARVAPSRESDSGAVGCLALSAIVNGQQSDEAVDATSRSDAKDRDGFAFETTIVRRLKDFYVVLDSGHNASLRHRIDPDLVTHLHLAGAATAFLFVSFPASLWLPYTNRLPPMDPSRPGRLIRLGLSDGADLAETDGGNYGASRTVSLAIGADPDGVKPLICEFCLTDSGQQAALAWMNDARQTRVAELCPVPLFSEIRTIDLLLADNGDCKLVVNKRIVSSYRADISPKDARWIVITGNISLLNVELENQVPTSRCSVS